VVTVVHQSAGREIDDDADQRPRYVWIGDVEEVQADEPMTTPGREHRRERPDPDRVAREKLRHLLIAFGDGAGLIDLRLEKWQVAGSNLAIGNHLAVPVHDDLAHDALCGRCEEHPHATVRPLTPAPGLVDRQFTTTVSRVACLDAKAPAIARRSSSASRGATTSCNSRVNDDISLVILPPWAALDRAEVESQRAHDDLVRHVAEFDAQTEEYRGEIAHALFFDEEALTRQEFHDALYDPVE
jgi:hypothetical protein